VKELNIPSFEPLTDLFLPSVPSSSRNFTYAFVPLDFMQGLFGTYGLDLPVLLGDLLDENDTLPSNLNLSTISYISKLLSTSLAFFVPNPHYSEIAGRRRGI